MKTEQEIRAKFEASKRLQLEDSHADPYVKDIRQAEIDELEWVLN